MQRAPVRLCSAGAHRVPARAGPRCRRACSVRGSAGRLEGSSGPFASGACASRRRRRVETSRSPTLGRYPRRDARASRCSAAAAWARRCSPACSTAGWDADAARGRRGRRRPPPRARGALPGVACRPEPGVGRRRRRCRRGRGEARRRARRARAGGAEPRPTTRSSSRSRPASRSRRVEAAAPGRAGRARDAEHPRARRPGRDRDRGGPARHRRAPRARRARPRRRRHRGPGARAAPRRRHRAVGLGSGLRVPARRGADRGGRARRPPACRRRRARPPDAPRRGDPPRRRRRGAEALRAAVTSPGGTTAAGLRVLEQHGVRGAFLDAVRAAAAALARAGRASDAAGRGATVRPARRPPSDRAARRAPAPGPPSLARMLADRRVAGTHAALRARASSRRGALAPRRRPRRCHARSRSRARRRARKPRRRSRSCGVRRSTARGSSSIPQRTVAAAAACVASASQPSRRRGGRIALATGRPASLLGCYGGSRRSPRPTGARVLDVGDLSGPIAGRPLALVGRLGRGRHRRREPARRRRRGAGDEWLFAVGRPDLVSPTGASPPRPWPPASRRSRSPTSTPWRSASPPGASPGPRRPARRAAAGGGVRAALTRSWPASTPGSGRSERTGRISTRSPPATLDNSGPGAIRSPQSGEEG